MTETPLVSMIIVVRNSINHIENSLKSIISQSYNKDKVELIFVDGMSVDGSYEYLLSEKEKLKKTGYSVVLLKNKNKTLASGWNLAIKSSNADYVCRIDAHAEIDSEYVKVGISTLLNERNNKVVAVGGWLKNKSGDSYIERTIAQLLCSPFGIGNSPVRRPKLNIKVTDTVAYGIYKKKEVIASGLYDESMLRNQDIDLNYRLHKNGLLFLTHPKMKAIYNVRSSIKKIIIKSYSDGCWVLKTPGKKIRHIIPFLFIAYLLITIVITFFGDPKNYYYLAPLLIYLICCLFFSLKKLNSTSILLIFLFPAFHISYGMGTLVSLLKTITKNRL
jgi:glycosyltransferase involved in cell wall biosynthesis